MNDTRYVTQRTLFTEQAARDQVLAYAAEMGWRTALVEGDPTRENFRVNFEVAPEVFVHYVEDFTSRQRYFYVTGPTELAIDQLATLVASDLATYALSDFLRACDVAEGVERARANMRLGVAAPYDYDEDVFERISAGMRHEDPRVRRLSMWATTYSPWGQYLPLLRDIARADPDPALRDRAVTILSVYESHGVRDQ
ncbi:hypothetical protein [Streptomyces sp. Adlamb9]|uniref:hypothetical protein n=1 Tax=Streptomyces TaxID=1883 RepID=UPI003F1B6D0A